jgi:AcrR family transcriptional regulator
LETAKRLAAEEGWSNVTTRKLAAQADLSYQTLYNYFPAKGAIIKELIAEVYQGERQAIDQLIEKFDGNLLDAINQLNVLRFKGLEDADSSWIKSVQSYFASSDLESSEISNIVEMIDQSGSDYYYQLLMASQRLRELDQNLDIQLMSYSLSVLANHALDRMLTNRETREALSQTLSEQIEQLLTPHLK